MPTAEIQPFVFRNPVSAGTHLFWFVWAVPLTLLLWRLARGDRVRQWSVGCFGLCMVLLYGASGVYHAIPAGSPTLIRYARLLDHSAIYLLIAGTYTPVFAVLLTGRLRIFCLSLVWVLAFAGIVCKWLLPMPPYPLTVGLYVATGWVGLLCIIPLVRAVGAGGMAVGMLGGVLYTAGGVFDALSWPVIVPGVLGYHEVLHVLDIFGTLAHLYFVTRYVLPFGLAAE